MLFVLCQLAVVAVVLAICAIVVPVSAPYLAAGALAVVFPNSVITLIMRNANPGALVVLAMVRSVVVAFTVIVCFLVIEPMMAPYLIGAGLGLAVITFVPIALTFLRPAHTKDSTKA